MRTVDELRDLVGDKVPSGSVPAAWWITTDSSLIAAYDSWKIAYARHRDKIMELAKSLGSEEARVGGWSTSSFLVGFQPPREMNLRSGHPDHVPAPVGWRIDSKKGYLVPSRKTKADRNSQANKDFEALRDIPAVGSYLWGMPADVYLDDRADMGGTIYSVQYRRGEKCVMAFSGGDPDRSPDREFKVDTNLWERQRLSTLLALREEVSA